MGYEWVSPVATATTGALGLFFTWFAGWQGRKHAETVSSNQLENARMMANDARRQQRLETAYIQMLDEAERVGNWSKTLDHFLETHSDHRLPQLPSLDDQARTAALVNAFGSVEVQQLMEKWRRIPMEMVKHAETYGKGNQISGFELSRARTELRRLQPLEKQARLALANQVSDELYISVRLESAGDKRSSRVPRVTGPEN